ncbi:hypothetical protein DL96DRAFT_1711119 [Flagelloscypha sp. PMI_526]|nr:hypothetical protein DL96DRAFT_1711119 [Flagelloscypha sp. PMI_526]
MASMVLPVEIWYHIVKYAPYRTLTSLQLVNHVFAQVVEQELAQILDFKPMRPSRTKKSLGAAMSNPWMIRTLRISEARSLADYASSSKEAPKTNGNIWIKLKDVKKKVFTSTSSHDLELDVRDLFRDLISLLSTRTGINELYILSCSGHPKSVPGHVIDKIFTLLSQDLTSVTLDLSQDKVNDLRFSMVNNSVWSLGQTFHRVREFRMIVKEGTCQLFHADFDLLLAAFPHLEELEYYASPLSADENSYNEVHPNLRMIKMTSSYTSESILYSLEINQHFIDYIPGTFWLKAHHFQVVRLTPRQIEYLDHLTSSLLLELRLDLSILEDQTKLDHVFKILSYARNLHTLDLKECSWMTHPFQDLPELPNLRRLYLGIGVRVFNAHTLRDLASKTQDLQTLAVRPVTEPLWPKDSWPTHFEQFAGQIQRFIAEGDLAFQTWKLEDFEITYPGMVLEDVAPLLRAFEKLPSVSSFYGSGSLELSLPSWLMEERWMWE